MKCIVQGCPGDMEERRIVHTFVRTGKPIVMEDLPARVCPVCGYTVLDLEVLNSLFAFDPETEDPVRQAPVFRLSVAPTTSRRQGLPAGPAAADRAPDAASHRLRRPLKRCPVP